MAERGAEARRIAENARSEAHWNRWGPYLSERQWGTVREDLSADGNAWEYFPHDHARSRAYRSGEDGLMGICDRHGELCFAIALWNGADPILKERLFGLTNPQGNHGEDVKEEYDYLDNVPSHAYMRMRYRYPLGAYPYEELVRINASLPRTAPEYELLDTGAFADGRHAEIEVEYAKADPEDIRIRLTIRNHAATAAVLHVLPTLWFRNRWSWSPDGERPTIRRDAEGLRAECRRYGAYLLTMDGGGERWLTGNDTNPERFPHLRGAHAAKDAFHEHLIRGAPLPEIDSGTKAAFHRRLEIPAHGTAVLRLRFHSAAAAAIGPGGVDAVIAARSAEADEFYADLGRGLSPADRAIQRGALAGLLWSKQHYRFDLRGWQRGDPSQPAPPPGRTRNRGWEHLHAAEVLLMPDKWEYPWFAAWDWAFQNVACALVDPAFAKQQTLLLLREWYMHPNGQLPAYEWAFGDVNPPVHAWAALRIYRMERQRTGTGDLDFLRRVFHKLCLNFTWWVNRTDSEGNNVFGGGFLGLDNIGPFDRNQVAAWHGTLEQADGTAWMAMYSLDLLEMACELAGQDPAYADMASKFLEHFLAIAHALNDHADGIGLWDEEAGFYFDSLKIDGGEPLPLRVFSLVGLTPLFGVAPLPTLREARVAGFSHRLDWLLAARPELRSAIADPHAPGPRATRLLSLTDRTRLHRLLVRLLDEEQFLSPFGIRSLSKIHQREPFVYVREGIEHRVPYEPGTSTTDDFGGNSNWRGPIWFPVNYMLIEALERYHVHYGDALRVECPTGSGTLMNLHQVAEFIADRLKRLFRPATDGRRPCWSPAAPVEWQDAPRYHEFFHAETGQGLGAAHQTGWTALIAVLFDDYPESGRQPGATTLPPPAGAAPG